MAQRHVLRTLTFVLGVFIMSLGIAVAIQADLGTTPIATLPTVLAFGTPMTVGFYVILLNLLFVVLQFLVLRGRLSRLQLLQVPVTFAFGFLIDVSVYLTQGISPATYLAQWGWTVFSMVLMAVGVYIETRPKLTYLPGEGMVVAMTMVQDRISFGKLKIILDTVLLLTSVAVSLVLLNGLEGVREGTVFLAFAVGSLLHYFNKLRTRLIKPRKSTLYETSNREPDPAQWDEQVAKEPK